MALVRGFVNFPLELFVYSKYTPMNSGAAVRTNGCCYLSNCPACEYNTETGFVTSL